MEYKHILHTYGKSVEHLWHTYCTCGMSQESYLAYVWHVPVIYVASLCGTCVACLLYIYCVCWHMEEHSLGISILHLWHVCGLSMVYLCNIYKQYTYGMSVVYVYDISMRHLWHSCCVSIYDISTNSKSMAIYGLPMASIYDISTHSVSMACLWLAYGMSIVCRWQTCGTSRKLLWNICCIPRASLWNIYGIPIAHVVCLRNHIWHTPVMFRWHIHAILIKHNGLQLGYLWSIQGISTAYLSMTQL